MDPVTLALLAPVALKIAEIAKPYVLKGLMGGVKQMILMGKDVLGVLRLPLGFVQATFLAPFGQFAGGIKNLVLGFVAPFRLAFHAMLLPVALTGFQIH